MGSWSTCLFFMPPSLPVTYATQVVRYPAHPLPGVSATRIVWYPTCPPRPQGKGYPERPLPGTPITQYILAPSVLSHFVLYYWSRDIYLQVLKGTVSWEKFGVYDMRCCFNLSYGPWTGFQFLKWCIDKLHFAQPRMRIGIRPELTIYNNGL